MQAARAPAGLPVTGLHEPGDAGKLHASHWPLQSLLQHTPSTQNVELH